MARSRSPRTNCVGSMMENVLPTVLGSLAGLLSTSSFVPQVIKAARDGDTAAISKRMYMVTVTAFVLWIAYGVVIGALPLIVFNSLSLALSGTILFLKIRNEGRAPAVESKGARNLQ